MASSGNFCTLNPLAQLGGSTDASTREGGMSDGNLKYVNQSNNTAVGTFGVTSGKWYYEVYVSSFNSDNGMAIGWANDLFNIDAELGYNSPSSPSGGQAFGLYSANQKLIYGPGDGGSSYSKSYGSGTPSDGDIIRIWLDADNGKFWAGLNGTIYGSGDPSAGTNWGFGTGGSPHNIAISSRTLYPAIGNWSSADATVIFNFGADSTFQGNVSAGSEVDGNGFGNFKYSTEGFLALCSANVPISDDIDPAQTDDDYPSKQFNAITYSGDNTTSNNITGLGFQPDLVWIKRRSSPDSNYSNSLMDSSRGHAKVIYAQMNNAERTSPSNKDLVSFDSDGFTVGQNYETNSNGSGHNHVAWCWRANGGVTSSNSEGATNSTVQANTKAGFSIIQYVGTGSNTTIGHGLDTAPDFMIHKNRDTTDNFVVYARSQGASKRAQLNSNIVWGTSTGSFNSTDPSSTLITLGSSSGTNASSGNYVCYAWHNVEGYQRFGTYIGNNTDNNGPFCYLGFRPRLLVIKGATEAYPWFVFDSARNPHNLVDKHLRWNGADAEATETTGARKVDFLSNGFRVMADEASLNGSGDTYVYMAWADVSFKYGNTF